MDTRIKIGISACLIGERVRYDGGHKLQAELVEALEAHFQLVPVCPEVDSGMSTPRPPMRLEGDPQAPRLVVIESREDKTEQMLAFCWRRMEALAQEDLSGFVLKTRSPSSGDRAMVYNKGARSKRGRGLFADALMKRFPLMPVENEERLRDPEVRENFTERVFTYARWSDFLKTCPGLGELVAFHSAHKLLVMAHSPVIYRQMGTLVGSGKDRNLKELLQQYGELLMTAMGLVATVRKNVNALQHIAGYFKRKLSAAEKAEIATTIDGYRQGNIPLSVPLTLLKDYALRYDQCYLLRQIYLSPLHDLS